MVIAYSYGIIDFLHYGHIRLFKDAKSMSDKYILGLISDDAINSFHGTLVSTYEERFSVLTGVKYIDEILPQSSFDPLQNLKIIHQRYPDAKIIFYTGTDKKLVLCEDYIKAIGGEIVITPYYEKLSPQNILLSLTAKKERSKYNLSNIISTKANTLLALKNKLTKAKIEDIEIVTVKQYADNFDQVLDKIAELYNGDLIVVRSSSTAEDALTTSNAGHFDSVLNVQSDNKESVNNAIKQVIDSYDASSDNFQDEQILIQRQTVDVRSSGVIFTRDVESNLPYYLINYDDQGSTDSVTSGSGGKTVRILRKYAKQSPPKEWKSLLTAVSELENLLNKMVLDIEFAITNKDEVIIFQVRPLAANYKFRVKSNDEIFYKKLSDEINRYHTISDYRTSNQMILSDMAFWNPSEIIGTNPHNLDYSLYRDIITKTAWNDGLVEMGYTKVADDLMFRVGNKPYISVDYSFISLTPDKLSKSIKTKLQSYYKENLLQDKTAHDKIEFEIVFNCMDFSTKKRLAELQNADFTDDEIEEIETALHKLTDGVITSYKQVLQTDLASLKEMDGVRREIEENLHKKENNVYGLLFYVYQLLKSIRRYGTPQFSRQARCAFISRAVCMSMVDEGHISASDMDLFMSSITTVATKFEEDFKLLASGEISIVKFNEEYGHLRSGTYDIRSPRYDAMNIITGVTGEASSENSCKETRLSEDITDKLKHNLGLLKFDVAQDEFMRFLRLSLEQREYFKFEFTKSLSLILEIIKQIGDKIDITAEDLSHLDISDVYSAEYYPQKSELKDFWQTIISKRKELFESKSALLFPEIIVDSNDLHYVALSESRPNFITSQKVVAETVCLDDNINQDINDKIVVISKADPGYDWIFTKNIAGLITHYGGAASHMAIRCAEFSLPAAIGCGEKIFEFVRNSERIELDCENKKIVRQY